MTEFVHVTPFEIIRRLAMAGQEAPSLYLLILEAADTKEVLADLAAEAHVQLGARLRSVIVSELRPDGLDDAFRTEVDQPIVAVEVDRWMPEIIQSMDRNIVLVTRARTVLVLAARELAGRVLSGAPNLRSRLTDVLAISPDEVFGGAFS